MEITIFSFNAGYTKTYIKYGNLRKHGPKFN